MRAALHRRHGGVDVLEVEDVPEPEVGPDDVLLAVRATALNRLDLLQREGPALVPGFSLPHIAGMDVAGEVIEVGRHVTSLAVGDRVVVNPALHCGECGPCRRGEDAWCEHLRVVGGNHPGGYAERVAVPATHAHRVPDAIGDAEAAAIPTAWATAWHGLFTVGDLRLGETVMVHAAASGVSTAAIQLAKRAGAAVVATAGSAAKLAVAADLGADVLVDNRSDDVAAAAKDATGGRGVDMVFDHVGPALFQASLLALRRRGRMVFCGTTTGVEATFLLPHAYHMGLRLLGADGYAAAEFEAMLAHYWTGGFRAVIDSEHPLADAGAAQAKLQSGDVVGKVLLRP